MVSILSSHECFALIRFIVGMYVLLVVLDTVEHCDLLADGHLKDWEMGVTNATTSL